MPASVPGYVVERTGLLGRLMFIQASEVASGAKTYQVFAGRNFQKISARMAPNAVFREGSANATTAATSPSRPDL